MAEKVWTIEVVDQDGEPADPADIRVVAVKQGAEASPFDVQVWLSEPEPLLRDFREPIF